MNEPYHIQRARLERSAEMQRRRAWEYDADQRRQFGESTEREPLKGTGKPVKIWKARPNQMVRTWGVNYEIFHGWAWQCSHPKHARRGKGSVTGSSSKGFDGALANVAAHWNRHHRNDHA